MPLSINRITKNIFIFEREYDFSPKLSMMNNLISCCGLNCEKCDARIATMANDDAMRTKVSDLWRTQYNVANITPDMINCTGCREEGVKIGHCQECLIRKCVNEKKFGTCGECDALGTCEMVAQVHKHAPDALTNLKGLN
jgi:hypothetical protein